MKISELADRYKLPDGDDELDALFEARPAPLPFHRGQETGQIAMLFHNAASQLLLMDAQRRQLVRTLCLAAEMHSRLSFSSDKDFLRRAHSLFPWEGCSPLAIALTGLAGVGKSALIDQIFMVLIRVHADI